MRFIPPNYFKVFLTLQRFCHFLMSRTCIFCRYNDQPFAGQLYHVIYVVVRKNNIHVQQAIAHGNVDLIGDVQYGQQRNAQEADELLTGRYY